MIRKDKVSHGLSEDLCGEPARGAGLTTSKGKIHNTDEPSAPKLHQNWSDFHGPLKSNWETQTSDDGIIW